VRRGARRAPAIHLRARLRACAAIAPLLIAGAPDASAPSSEELAAATYPGIQPEPITLENGDWSGEPYDPGSAMAPRAGLVDGFRLSGDLNADGRDEAIVMLWFSGGGTGSFHYVAVVGRENGAPRQLGIAPLGDRVQVRAAQIEGARIAFDTIQSGPDDAACCPGQSFRRVWELTGDEFREIATKDGGRATLDLAAGIEWRLDEFAADALVPVGVEVTLRFEGDRLGGSSGCNRYSAPVAAGDGPLTLRVGPTAGTARACQGEAAVTERRFLGALPHVERFGFSAGRLALMWSRDDEYGTLLFSPRLSPR